MELLEENKPIPYIKGNTHFKSRVYKLFWKLFCHFTEHMYKNMPVTSNQQTCRSKDCNFEEKVKVLHLTFNEAIYCLTD